MITDKDKIKLKKIGKRIKELRRRKGLTQLELAGDLNTDRGYISRIELGAVDVRLTSLLKLCEALDVDIKELFNFPH